MKYTKEEWEKVFELYQKEYGPAHISRITGIHRKTIQHRCRQYDLSGDRYTQRKANVRPNSKLKKTVYRLMKEEGLKNVRRRCKYRSYKGEVGKTAPNILNRDFGTTGPNQKWTTDVTQINIGADKCYLSPILDMYNGEIVSYAVSDHPDLKMVMEMLDRAYAARATA